MKQIWYSIPELNINSSIWIDTNLYKPLDGLIKQIASDNHILNEYLKVDNPPKEELKNMIYYEFKLSLHVDNPDINISILDKNITIKNCYSKKFMEILPYIEKNGIYFSSECIRNNIQLLVSNNEIPLDGYPFLSTYTFYTFNIKLKDFSTVKLKYGRIYFFLNENELSSTAVNLIEKAFPDFNIKIQDSNHGSPYILRSKETYTIKVVNFVTFKNLDDPRSYEIFDVELLSRVSDVRKNLAKELKKSDINVQPENLIIYDKDQKKIDDVNKLLANFQKFDNDFFYKILEIKSKKNFYYSIQELQKSMIIISIDTSKCQTINDLKRQIALDLNISDYQLEFIKPPTKQLKELNDYYNFDLSYTCPNPDADILIPGGKIITIKDCYKKNFDEIIDYLGQEGLYYSLKCIRTNIHLYLSNEEIPQKGYYLLTMKNFTILELRMIGSTITLNYDGKQFTFTENEAYYEAINLIEKVYNSFRVSIHDDHDEKIDKLISTKKYCILVERTFKYSIKELAVSTQFIKVDINECYSPDVLKSKIARIHHVLDDELQFDKPIKTALKEIPEYTGFDLIFRSLHPDIDVLVQNGKKFSIKNFYKMTYNDIFKSLEKEGIYYSPECVKTNLHIYLSGNEITQEKFPIFSVPKNSELEIKLTGPTVTLQYDKFQFTLSENETKLDANKLIKKVFPTLDLLILDSHGIDTNYLQSKEKYNVSVGEMHTFSNIDDYFRISIFIDLFDTVLDIQKKISKQLKSDSDPIIPEMITIYNPHKNPILDISKPLKNFHGSYQWLYYKINKEIKSKDSELKLPTDILSPETEAKKLNRDKDILLNKHLKDSAEEADSSFECIKINLIFTGSYAKKYYPMRDVEVPLKSTIDDVINIVRKKNSIKDKIKIKLKINEEMKPLESTLTINDIKDLIQEEGPNNKIQNIIYVNVELKEKDLKSKETLTLKKEEDEREKKILPEYKKSEESPKKSDLSSRYTALAKESSTGTSSSEDDYSKKRTQIRESDDWSSKAKYEKEDAGISLIRKQTTSRCKGTDAVDEVLPKKNEGAQIQKNTQKKRSNSLSRYKPKTTPLPKSPDQASKEPNHSALTTYKFEFKGKKKEIKLEDNSTFEQQEENIRNIFDIEASQPIIFIFINKDDDEESIKDMKQQMKAFKKGIIRINPRARPIINKNKIKPTKQIQKTPPSQKELKQKSNQKSEPKKITKPESESETKTTTKEKEKEKEKPETASSEGDMTEYICQIGNDEEDIEHIKLGGEATVKTMKEHIGNLRKVEDPSTIKITFAGKELPNDIKLAPMKIGRTKLFIYIPMTGDILLMTAKGLQYKKNGSDDDDYDDD